MTQSVRTRFAPSPTGFLHVGGIRTALFAWLVAQQANGAFILRLEDTDKKREVPGSDKHLMESLRALGLEYDEGPDKPGEYGPYLQSERLDSYKIWAEKLIASGRAYADPYSPEELQKLREQAQKNKQPFLYRNHRPAHPPKWDGSQPLRFKSDPQPYTWHDEVMGELKSGPEVVDDFILIKSDGYPTYNFAHIIDDHEMKISHIIRGQEFIASMPNYLNLYEALDIIPPVFATMPHILGPDGNKKLSKRDNAKDVLDYIRQGFLPEALVNFIATLGWNDGTEQEIYSVSELIEKFSLKRVQRSGARFDERRLLWTNGAHIRQLNLEDLYEKVADFWPESAKAYDDTYKKAVLDITQERLKYFAELPELTEFFFTDLPVNPALISEHKQLKKLTTEELRRLLVNSRETLAYLEEWDTVHLQDTLNELLEKLGQKPAVLLSLVRIASTQAPSSPGLAESLAILGKERSLERIDRQIQALA